MGTFGHSHFLEAPKTVQMLGARKPPTEAYFLYAAGSGVRRATTQMGSFRSFPYHLRSGKKCGY